LNDLRVGGVDNDLLTGLSVEEDLPSLLDHGPALQQLALSIDNDLLAPSGHYLARGLNDLRLLLLHHSRLLLNDSLTLLKVLNIIQYSQVCDAVRAEFEGFDIMAEIRDHLAV